MFIPPFSISDVADLLAIQRLQNDSSGAFPVVCPFCGDRRGKMNFCVWKDGKIKNTYHCYNCGAQGNMLQLYAELCGISGEKRYKNAYWKIMHRLKQEAKGVLPISMKQEAEKLEEMKAFSSEPADYRKRDQVYRALLDMLHLKEEHKADLIRRGLTLEQISHMEEIGFKSTSPEEAGSLARRLLKQGYSLNGVPGFYVNRNGDWRVAFYGYNTGYLCPVWTMENELSGFQIHMDHPFKGMKYGWFTSSGKKKGCSSKSPAGIFGNPDVRVLYVTEGILKAAVAHELTGKTFLGNPGVGHYKELEVILKVMRSRGLKTVMECYDMDKLMQVDCWEDYHEECVRCQLKRENEILCPKKLRKREDIRTGCNHLYRICRELGLKCIRVTWDTDDHGNWLGNFKGIDDWQAGRWNAADTSMTARKAPERKCA